MKIIILAGGYGTRISEETENKPKPMVLLGEKPIVWHLMNTFAKQGFSEFVIATGYKSEVIHNWVDAWGASPWDVTAIDTGLETQTGGRIAQCMDTLPNETVIVTYGDGLGNIKVKELLAFHGEQGREATVTAVRPPARFGVVESSGGKVTKFGEKDHADAGWINGGFFVLEPHVRRRISSDVISFEFQTLPEIVEDSQLSAFHHFGFWQPMDTLREKNELTKLAQADMPPWLKDI